MNKLEIAGPSLSVAQVVMLVLWPAFLMAIASCGVIFSQLDPAELSMLVRAPHLGRLGFYSLGFLVFWLLGSIASSLTVLLLLTGRSVRT